MDRKEADFLASLIYKEIFTESGHSHPKTYEEMLAIFLECGADVVHCPNLPRGIPGASIGTTVYINADESVSDSQRIIYLAHEFAHYKRRDQSLWPQRIRFYKILPRRLMRDDEEQIARAFMRLF